MKKIIVATTTSKLDDELAAFLRSTNLIIEEMRKTYSQGFYFAAKENDAEVILRITGDCPVMQIQR